MVKRKERIFILLNIVVLVIIIFGSFTLNGYKAYAGQSDVIIVNNNYFSNDLPVGYFYKEGDIVSENAHIVFKPSSDGNSFINSKTKALNLKSVGIEKFIDLSSTLNFKSINNQTKAGFSFGLSKMYSKHFGAGTTFIYFMNDNGTYKYGIDNYESMGKQVIVSPMIMPSERFSLNTDVSVSISITASGGITLNIGGETVYSNANAGCYTEGFFGVGQTGTSNFEIKTLVVTGKSYDTPTNAGDISVDFNDGLFNSNLWHCQGHIGYLQPSRICVEDKMLKFVNASEGIFSTRHPYSNFELVFDIPYIQRVPEYYEDGSLKYPISSWIGVAFGRTTDNMSSSDAVNETPMFMFSPNLRDVNQYILPVQSTTVSLRNYGEVVSAAVLKDNRNIWGEDVVNGRSYNVKLSMVDGVFNAYGKFEDENDYQLLINYNFGFTPTGYIQFWSMGYAKFAYDSNANMQGNFAIDNISLKNLDNNPSITQVSYKSNRPDIPPDYNYVDTWDDSYLLSNQETETRTEVTIEGNSGCSSTVFVELPVVCVLAACIVFSILLNLRFKEKK